MANINTLKPNQTVYSIEKQKMGNTTTTRNALYEVRIVEVNVEKGWVMASWNGNAPTKFFLSSIARWKVNKPEPKGKVAGLPTY